jgi:hypothetical protein
VNFKTQGPKGRQKIAPGDSPGYSYFKQVEVQWTGTEVVPHLRCSIVSHCLLCFLCHPEPKAKDRIELAHHDPSLRCAPLRMTGIGKQFAPRSHTGSLLSLIIILLAVAFIGCSKPQVEPGQRLTGMQWVALSESLSETGGYFDSDNLVTNESSYQHVLDKLISLTRPGGIYLGVGPEQNFTYIAAVRPSLAIIIDIRRDNMLQHLWYKALFESYERRADFLAAMVGRAMPPSYQETTATRLADMVAILEQVPASNATFEGIRDNLRARITGLGFHLEARDWDFIQKMEEAFFRENFALRFTSFRRHWQRRYPNLREVLLEKDLRGRQRHFLNSEAEYRYLRQMQMENRIVPVTGDMAGTTAMKAIGDYVRKAGKTVTTFYVSNVEYYLFRSRTFRGYLDNVRSLPITPDTLFIRSYFNYSTPHPEEMPGYYVASCLQRIGDLLQAVDQGKIHDYWDVSTAAYIPLVDTPQAAPQP